MSKSIDIEYKPYILMANSRKNNNNNITKKPILRKNLSQPLQPMTIEKIKAMHHRYSILLQQKARSI